MEQEMRLREGRRTRKRSGKKIKSWREIKGRSRLTRR
jgi:hypothetical protein